MAPQISLAFHLEEPDRVASSAAPGRGLAGHRPALLVEGRRGRPDRAARRRRPARPRPGWPPGAGRDGTRATIGMMSEPDDDGHRPDGVQPSTVTRAPGRAPPPRTPPAGAARAVLAGIEAAAGEAHLAPVRPQRRGAPGEDQPGLARLLEERDQHGRSTTRGGLGRLVGQRRVIGQRDGLRCLGNRAGLALCGESRAQHRARPMPAAGVRAGTSGAGASGTPGAAGRAGSPAVGPGGACPSGIDQPIVPAGRHSGPARRTAT